MAARNVTAGDAIYARYSSDQQNARSIADQVERLRGEVERHGGAFDRELVYSDGGTSGAVWERSGLQALLRAVEQGRVRRIFTEDVSRMSRDPEDQARLSKLIEFRDVKLITPDGVKLDGSSGASLMFSVEGAMAVRYLKDLGDKTRRGLQGNAREGKSTGGRTYGYRTNRDDATITIDAAQAAIVRRIFTLYAQGHGYATIAAALNRDGIEPPRGTRRHRGGSASGWIASCVREMLRNARYVGAWTFGRREWRRHPVTRKRVARERTDATVLHVERPELAIIERGLWDQVQAKLASHAQARKTTDAGSRAPRKPTSYLLSSLLRCACCGGLLQIASGSSDRYYRCSTNRKRGEAVCSNALSVRESVARARILGAISDSLSTPDAVDYIRKRLGERLGAMAREANAELAEREARLARVEERIRSIIAMQVDGDRSPYVADMRRDFEAQAVTERAIVSALRAQTGAPIRLPNVPELAERVRALCALADADPAAAREALRRYLKGGVIACSPEGGRYMARAELIPLAVMLDGESPLSSGGCAGRI